MKSYVWFLVRSFIKIINPFSAVISSIKYAMNMWGLIPSIAFKENMLNIDKLICNLCDLVKYPESTISQHKLVVNGSESGRQAAGHGARPLKENVLCVSLGLHLGPIVSSGYHHIIHTYLFLQTWENIYLESGKFKSIGEHVV